MKIALILPRAGLYRYKTGGFSTYLRYAPLTLTTLAALIPPDLNAQVFLYDEGIETIQKEEIDADLVGITSITGASERAYAFADYFRNKGKTVIIGGVHATLLPEEAKLHSHSVVIGHAFETWPKAIRDFSNGSLKSFYYPPDKINFSTIPLPSRYLLRYQDRFITTNSVQAVFGCPHSCEFCVTPVVCHGYHHRPVDDVVYEVRALKGKYFVFVDPSPVEDVGYSIKLYNALIPLKKKWTGLATTKLFRYPTLMDAMMKAGCKGLLIGFESLSQRSNNTIHKGFNRVEDFYTLVHELHTRGIAIMGCFVHGLDGDDVDCFKRTLEFVNQSNIDLPRFTICTPFPGTPFFQKLKEKDRIITERWSLYDGQHAVFRPSNMTVKDLEEGHAWIWKEAYTLPQIVKRLSFSRCFLEVSILANIAYRRYGHRLKYFPADVMMADSMI